MVMSVFSDENYAWTSTQKGPFDSNLLHQIVDMARSDDPAVKLGAVQQVRELSGVHYMNCY